MSNIIVFGAGDYYRHYIDFIKEKDTVMCILDNNRDLWGKKIDGVLVVCPEKADGYNYDYIVLLVSTSTVAAFEIKKQLLGLGVDSNKILFYDEYMGLLRSGEYTTYYPQKAKDSVLIIVSHLSYDGGSMAVYHAALYLKKHGYNVTLAVSWADMKFVREAQYMGIEIVVYPAILKPSNKEKEWVQKFLYIICSDEFMLNCVRTLNEKCHLAWWLHGPSEAYEGLVRAYGKLNLDELNNVDIYAVSCVAKRNFLNTFGEKEIKLLPYGVLDTYKVKRQKKSTGKIIFAVIAGFCKLKAQDIFLQAAGRLNEVYADQVEYWLIGKCDGSSFSDKIREMANKMPNVMVKGILTRKEMEEAYEDIDVVVCPSWEECLPTVIVEGMMHKKVGIVSDNTGLNDYIVDENNGLICKTGEASDLYEKMRWILENPNKLDDMRQKARKTYEENFSMDVFGKRFINVLEKS